MGFLLKAVWQQFSDCKVPDIFNVEAFRNTQEALGLESSHWALAETNPPGRRMTEKAQWVLPLMSHYPLKVSPSDVRPRALSSQLHPSSISHLAGTQQMCLLNDFVCMCFIKPLNTHNLISDLFSKPLMSTYYVLAQNLTLEGSNKSLQICPSPALDHKLPARFVFSPSSQSCVLNTGHAEQWVLNG